jgi:hypothetical protein
MSYRYLKVLNKALSFGLKDRKRTEKEQKKDRIGYQLCHLDEAD